MSLAPTATIGGTVLGTGVGTAVGLNEANAISLPRAMVTELARTGADSTVVLAIVAVLLLLMGVLLMGLVRRHRDLGPSLA